MVLLYFLFLLPGFLSAQETRVSGEASGLMNNPAISKYQYEEKTYRMAVNNAIEKAFGTSVVSNYERVTSTKMEGRSLVSHSDLRNNYLNTFPNGVWVADENRKCYESKDDHGNWWMTCEVVGLAREVEAARVLFRAQVMDGTDPNTDISENFQSGESAFLHFKSPEDGFITIFFNDMQKVQRCVPYNRMPGNCLKVESNREYFFFSSDPEHCTYTDPAYVDEIELYTENALEYNQFIVLFSKEPFKGYLLEEEVKNKDGYSGFKSMSGDDFHSWLQENRLRNKNLQIQILGVVIKNQ